MDDVWWEGGVGKGVRYAPRGVASKRTVWWEGRFMSRSNGEDHYSRFFDACCGLECKDSPK